MINHNKNKEPFVTVVGAGLTGLTTAYWLKRRGVSVHVVETSNTFGGQIQTQHYQQYTYETGPTTSSVSTPEVAELMMDLEKVSNGACQLEIARESAKRRLIWKGDRFHDLPSGPLSGLTTPLFRFSDKLRILGEPWRSKGTDPDESVGALARRRLGKSFVDYAVDPFISGVYAGDPDALVTRYALPKLYALERDYGSFVRGAMAKMKEPKSDRDRLATKKVFSALGGMSEITKAEAAYIGEEHMSLGVCQVVVEPAEQEWTTSFIDAEGQKQQLKSQWVVTTCGAYNLPQLLPFVDKQRMETIARLKYAPVMEVNVGIPDRVSGDYNAFGGLVPTCEHQPILGVLFPSACFKGRSPKQGALFSFFIGGVKHPEMLEKSDAEIEELVNDCLRRMLKFPAQVKPDFIHISRHQHAIPQYSADSGARFEAVASLEQQYPGLIVGGNLRDGIGMGHRITQATNIINHIIKNR